jgi:hypothetical protein
VIEGGQKALDGSERGELRAGEFVVERGDGGRGGHAIDKSMKRRRRQWKVRA